MAPAERGITPDQVAASFFHSLGIDFRREYHTHTGRPIMIVREGSVIPGLFGQ
jgi:G:T-mismatch repair DNA endonuclease (very short patch repair protein)